MAGADIVGWRDARLGARTSRSASKLLFLQLLATLLTTPHARVVLSVDVRCDDLRARVIDSSNGQELGESTASSMDGWWSSLGDACTTALEAAGCALPDVACIELHQVAPTRELQVPRPVEMPRSEREIMVQPSVLAADIGSLSAAAREVAAAGAKWVHVDITDGSLIAGRSLSSIGPASVAAVRAAAPALLIDVHLYTLDPEAHFRAVAEAGADRITFQMESMGSLASGSETEAAQSRAMTLASDIAAAGCRVGVCIAPDTPIDVLLPLCRERAVDLVDILTVNPGIGGQKLQPAALDKVRALRDAHPELPYLLVDGGIDDTTAPLAAEAGANALVSGSYLFRAPPGGMGERLRLLETKLAECGD